jgi:hypothetical protein
VPTLQFTAYLWVKNECVDRIDYNLSNELFTGPAAAPAGATMLHKNDIPTVNYYVNDRMDYLINFMASIAIPLFGSITIELPGSYPAFPETTCYNYLSPSESNLTGAFVCVCGGNKCTVTGFDALGSSKNVKLRVAINHPAAAGGTGDITFATWGDTGSTLLVESSIFSKTILATPAPLAYEFRRQLYPMDAQRQGIFGPIRFTMSPIVTITKKIGKIRVTVPGF